MALSGYSEDQRAEAIAAYAASHSFADASRQTGIPAYNIRNWVKKGTCMDGAVRAKAEDAMTRIGDMCERVVIKILESIDNKTVDEANLLQRAQAIEKIASTMQLMRGEATANIDMLVAFSPIEAAQQARELAERIRLTRAALPAPDIIDAEIVGTQDAAEAAVHQS